MFTKYLLSENTSEDITEDRFLTSPISILVILITYLGFVLKIGPGFMKNRPPFNLKLILVAYNVIQVYISVLVFYITTTHLMQNGLIIRQQCSTQSEEFKKKTASIIHIYYLAKISELLDTVFFVLRKRDRQVSFLHVYHHSFAAVFSWSLVSFEPAYVVVLPGALNSFVHIVMYSYYGLSAFPSLTKYLWWKKYITEMQLVQFFLMVLYLTLSHTLSSCSSSHLVVITLISNNLLFVYLFMKFYVREYLKSRRSEKMVNDVTTGENKSTYKIN